MALSYPCRLAKFVKTPKPLTARHLKHNLKRLICLALVLNLFILSSPNLARHIPGAAYYILNLVAEPVLKVSHEIGLLFGSKPAAPRQKETLADRVNRVARIRVSPSKMVGYQQDRITFSALATDSLDRTIQGVAFEWESSNPDKVEIDRTGRARLLHPGLITLTCRAGSAEASARLLVKPGGRPAQTDEEWKRDQAELSASNSTGGRYDGLPESDGLLAALFNDSTPALSDYPIADSPQYNLTVSAATPARNTPAKHAGRALSAAAPLPQGYSGNDVVYDELQTR